MSTSPILVAPATPSSLPSPGSVCPSASGDQSVFHQVLQEMSSGAGPTAGGGGNSSRAAASDTAQEATHNATLNAAQSAIQNASQDAIGGALNERSKHLSQDTLMEKPGGSKLPAGFDLKDAQSDVTNLFTFGSKTGKEKAAGKSVPLDPKLHTKAEEDERKAAKVSQANGAQPYAAIPAVVHLAATSTPTEVCLSVNNFSGNASDATLGGSTETHGILTNDVAANFAATVRESSNLRVSKQGPDAKAAAATLPSGAVSGNVSSNVFSSPAIPLGDTSTAVTSSTISPYSGASIATQDEIASFTFPGDPVIHSNSSGPAPTAAAHGAAALHATLSTEASAAPAVNEFGGNAIFEAARAMLPAAVPGSTGASSSSAPGLPLAAKPRTRVPASGASEKASRAAATAPDGGGNADSVFKTTRQVQEGRSSVAGNQFVNSAPVGAANGASIGTSAADHSASLRSGDESSSRLEAMHSSHTRQITSPGDNSSDTQEKSADIASADDRDPSILFAPTAAITHATALQSALDPPSTLPTPSGAASIGLGGEAGLVVTAQPAPGSAPLAAHGQPQIQSNPIPDPPRMVDSGQLQVTPNHSELKISVQVPELGKVEVRAVTAHDVTTAHLTAFRHDALQVLAADRTGLEQALKSRDVILGSFNSSTQGNSNAQGHSGGQQRQPNSQSSYQSSGGASSLAAAAANSITSEASTTGFLPEYSSISVRV